MVEQSIGNPFANHGSNLSASFKAGDGNFKVTTGERDALEVSCSDSKLFVSLYYDSHEQPLILTAPVKAGDEITLVVYPHRCELRVNSELFDEEWPFGEALFEQTGKFIGQKPPIVISIPPDDVQARGKLPPVMRSFEGVNTVHDRGINIGDCMPFSDDYPDSDGRYHLFYLYDRHHHHSKWGFGAHQWAHISTSDLKHWDEHPMVVPITEPWEGSICTGSIMRAEPVVREGEKYYAWYAIRMSDRSPARLTCSVSPDNIHYVKTDRYFTLPEAYEPTNARDPKVISYEGSFHMFVTTTCQADGRGCLAHLTSDDLINWSDAGVLYETPNESQPECPDWFKMGDYYYLVYGYNTVGTYVFSKSPFSGWKETPNNTIPCGAVPKSALLGGRRIFFGFNNSTGYAGDALAVETKQSPDGSLSFTEISL